MLLNVEVDRNGLEVLGRNECLRLLASATLGRIAFTSGALPVVLPVNFRLHGEQILVRTSRGSTLDTALRNTVVAFEVDDFDHASSSGDWSVALTGMSTAVTDPTELGSAHPGPAPRWAPEGAEAVLAISTALLSGRRRVTVPHASSLSVLRPAGLLSSAGLPTPELCP